MPNGKVHSSVTVLSTVYLGAASIYLSYNDPSLLPTVALIPGCLSGILVGPDLDVDGGNISRYLIRKHLGPVASWLWWAYWWPYAKLMPHRSFASHIPVLSTAIRAIYSFWWLALLWQSTWPLEVVQWFFVGLAVSDFHHWFLDVVSGSW